MPYDDYSSVWEGTSPNAAADMDRMGGIQERNRTLWDILFGRTPKDKITSTPLPEPYGPVAPSISPSPFGGAPVAPASPKPVSKLSSAANIAQRVSQIIQQPWTGEGDTATYEPIRRVMPTWTGEGDTPGVGDPLTLAVNQHSAEIPPTPRVPVDLKTAATPGKSILDAISDYLVGGGEPAFNGSTTSPYGGRFGAAQKSTPFTGVDLSWISKLGGLLEDQARRTSNQFGANVQSPTSWNEQALRTIRNQGVLDRAEGGGVPGFMRGGYPELYNAPVRHFDSGGQSYVGGGGESDGRADDISARLSPKEYVIDAETMSMLGDGNPDHGAKRMDQFRANVRKHKGKALAQGKFSPNAKNPMDYLVGNPAGDGLRRLGKKQ